MQSPRRCLGSMFQSDDRPHFPSSWMRFDYLNVPVPSLDGAGLASARLPALSVRTRPANAPPGPGRYTFRARGQLDTGAQTSAAPIWLIRQMCIPIDERSRRRIYGVAGILWAYGARIGIEILCNSTWLDLGVANVLVPDTPWSRDPTIRRPLLLGLDGFFDRVGMYIAHSREEFWLGLPRTAVAGIGQRVAEPPRA